MNEIFTALTGGVLEGVRLNLVTVAIAILGISVLIMGFDKIRELLDGYILDVSESRGNRRIMDEFGIDGGKMTEYRRNANKYRGTVAGDLYQRKYDDEMSSYSKGEDDYSAKSHNGNMSKNWP